MKQKLVALLLVSVMVASGFSAISLSATKVDALVGTTLSLTASTTTPLSGESYTLSGSLTDSTGTALGGKPIDIWVRHDGDNGILWKTMTTDSNGKYSTTAISTKKAYIRTVFNGDSAYAGSRSDLVTVTPTSTAIPTKIEFLVVPLQVKAGDKIGVTVGITAGGGTLCTKGLAVSMFVDRTYAGQAVTTTCDGVFGFTYQPQLVGTHVLAAYFAGNGQYAPSAGGPASVEVV